MAHRRGGGRDRRGSGDAGGVRDGIGGIIVADIGGLIQLAKI